MAEWSRRRTIDGNTAGSPKRFSLAQQRSRWYLRLQDAKRGPLSHIENALKDLESAIARLRQANSPDLADHVERLAVAKQYFHRFLAAALEPTLNEHVRSHPATTLEQKFALANTVTEALKRLGLAVIDEHTGKPMWLYADARSNAPDGSFQLRRIGDTAFDRGPLWREPPPLRIVPAPEPTARISRQTALHRDRRGRT